MIKELIKLLTEIKESEQVDAIKVYFLAPNDYCVKLIKGEKIVKCHRVGIGRKIHTKYGNKSN